MKSCRLSYLCKKSFLSLIGLEKWARRPTCQAQRGGALNAISRPLCASPKQRSSPLGPKVDLG